MPTYEYLCRTCGHRFETWQKMTDEPLTTCPECGQEIRRVLFPAGVVFKGSGFYKTDYSSNGKKNNSASANEHTNQSESKTSESKSSSESKTSESTTSKKSDTSSSASSTSSTTAANAS